MYLGLDRRLAEMRIAKPLLLITTPLGVIGGLHEAWRLAGGLVFLMFALVAMIGAAIGMLVMTIRKEERERLQRLESTQDRAAEKP